MRSFVAGTLLCAGCSLAFPMGEYDEGSGGADAGPECGGFANPPISEIQESFDGDGPSQELAFNGCGTFQDGELFFNPIAENEYCWIYNTNPRQLTCDALTVRLTDSGSQVHGFQRFIYLNVFGTEQRIFVLEETGGFNFEVITPVDTSFDPEADAWWRLRATRDTLFFETSSDGISYEVKASGPPPFPLDSVMIQLGAGAWLAIDPPPPPVSYDCLNVPPPCP